MFNLCKKCNAEFVPQKGLKNFCSLSCRNSRQWTEEDKKKKSESAKNNERVKSASKKANYFRNLKLINEREGTFLKDNRICYKVNCIYCNEEFETFRRGINSHKECYNKTSGGYKTGSGYGNSGWYKGYFCDSSYELCWVIYNLEHNINFKRNTQKFKYFFEEKEHHYIPDFILDDGTYVEIKGYYTKQVEAKISQFPHKIELFYKEDLQKEFDYVISKYGKNFVNLYEDYSNKFKNKCLNCNKATNNQKYCGNKCSAIHRKR